MANPPRETRQMWVFDDDWMEAGIDVPAVQLVTAQQIPVQVVDRPPSETKNWVFWYSQETKHIGREGVRFFATEREALEAAFASMAPYAYMLAQRKDTSAQALVIRQKFERVGSLLAAVRGE